MTYRVPGQRVKFGASELNRLNQAADIQFLAGKLQEQVIPDDQQAHWVWVRNDSGADRERFECVKLGDPLWEMLADGTTDLMFAGEAAGTGTTAILLEPIAQTEFGKAVIHGLALAKVAGGTGTMAAPNASGVLEPGSGTIKLLASPHATLEKLLPVLLGATGESGILDLRTNAKNLQYTFSDAPAEVDWTTFATFDMRLSGTSLQFTLDGGTTWHTWHTVGTVCPP